jgi:hypothetical protein
LNSEKLYAIPINERKNKMAIRFAAPAYRKEGIADSAK